MTEWVPLLDDQRQLQIRELIVEASRVDGVAPVGEQVLRELRGTAAKHLVVEEGDDVVAYLNVVLPDQAAPESATAMAELVVAPAARRRGIGSELIRQALAKGGEATRIWAHGNLPAARALAAKLGLVALRRLHQMRRPLAELPTISADSSVVIRHYAGPQDDSELLRVNNAAFAWHPEQGGWTLDDLTGRFAEPWFDPRGLFLAFDEQTGDLLGFHWTKKHLDKPGVGEVYVVGVDPAAQGRGLGHLLTLVGLHHLAAVGLHTVLLYVESDNAAALRTYERLGFGVALTDAAYGRG
ncbi:mycothiol synthase [Mycobacteroides saopaulense]|uniref:Mycothiol acetyltransferase n=1 Tax=Mycobacteroides saopaulense TaxID=1578165 RepID=A0A1S4VA82_9MYCO|nr:mycothiol synthase [Mycobacteroides saopaulense]ALR10649.1 mycothiol acetyltransferase [Mycobacteroides saopaulense]ORB53462.1 mycothiol synthase [Mycobacteroides saopaulense]